MVGSCDIDYGTASYRGLEFQILPSTRRQGRRINSTLYPFIDGHYNEDLGDTPDTFSVSGVFTGESARDNYTVAQRLWKIKGEGILFEPTGNQRHAVQVVSIDWGFENLSVNYVPFTLTLVEFANNPYPQTATNLFGQVNALIDSFITTASSYYTGVMTGINEFSSVLTGFEAAAEFTYNTVRQTVTSNYFNVANAANTVVPSSTSSPTTAANVTAVFETAADNAAPIEFYRQAAEVRFQGNEIEEAQALLFALNATAYYFEAVSAGVGHSEYEQFINRVTDLKEVVGDSTVREALNGLVIAAGGLQNIVEFKTATAPEHALVASYQLYGDISRATEIMGYSGGVSGASLNVIRYVE